MATTPTQDITTTVSSEIDASVPPTSPQEAIGERQDTKYHSPEEFKWQMIIRLLIPDFAKAFQRFSIQFVSQVESLLGRLENYCESDAHALFLTKYTTKNRTECDCSAHLGEEDGNLFPPTAIRSVIGCLWHLNHSLKEMTKRMNKVENASTEVYLPEIINLLQQSQPEEAKDKATFLLCLMEETEDGIVSILSDMYNAIESAIEGSQDPQLSHMPTIGPFLQEFDQELHSLHAFLHSNFSKHWETLEDIDGHINHDSTHTRQRHDATTQTAMSSLMETNEENKRGEDICDGYEDLKKRMIEKNEEKVRFQTNPNCALKVEQSPSHQQ